MRVVQDTLCFFCHTLLQVLLMQCRFSLVFAQWMLLVRLFIHKECFDVENSKAGVLILCQDFLR